MQQIFRPKYGTPPLLNWLAIALVPIIGIVAGVTNGDTIGLSMVAVAVGVLVVAVVFVHPIFGLALTLMLSPLGAWESLRFGLPIPSGQLMLLFTLLVWIIRSLLIERRVWIARTPITALLWVFTFVASITVWYADTPWDGIKEVGKWVEMALIVWLVADSAETPPFTNPRYTAAWRKWFIPGMLALLFLPALAQAALAYRQYALIGSGPGHLIISEGRYRAYGTFMQPNPYGGYAALNLNLAIGLMVGLISYTWRRLNLFSQIGWRNWLGVLAAEWRLLLLTTALGGGTLILALGLLASWSRGAWLSFLIGMGVLVLLLPQKRWQGIAILTLATVGFGVGVVIGIIPQSIFDRLLGFLSDFQVGDVRGVEITGSNFSIIERVAHWQAAVGMARDHLWQGVGFGNYEAVYDEYALLAWPLALGHAHNYYLNLLAETGMVGLIAYLITWGGLMWLTWRVAQRSSFIYRGLALGLLIGWIALSVHHLLDNLYVNNSFIHIGAMFGLLELLRQRSLHGEDAAGA